MCHTEPSGPRTDGKSWPETDFAASLALSSCAASVRAPPSFLVLRLDADTCKRRSTGKRHAASSVCKLEAQAVAHESRSEFSHTLCAFFQCRPEPKASCQNSMAHVVVPSIGLQWHERGCVARLFRCLRLWGVLLETSHLPQQYHGNSLDRSAAGHR